jgi:hypothetical protein
LRYKIENYCSTWFIQAQCTGGKENIILALVFLQWRLNHAHAKDSWHPLADVVRQYRYEHARTLLETACQETAKLSDYLPVLKRFLCQPT